MQALATDVDRAVDADRRFFERRPDRSHRLRLLTAAERTSLAITSPADAVCPPGERWACAVKQVAPGARLRRFFRCPEGADLDKPEWACREIFDTLNAGSEVARQAEDALREAMGVKS